MEFQRGNLPRPSVFGIEAVDNATQAGRPAASPPGQVVSRYHVVYPREQFGNDDRSGSGTLNIDVSDTTGAVIYGATESNGNIFTPLDTENH